MSEILKAKYLDRKYEKLSWVEISDSPVSAISGVSREDARELEEALGVKTIRDFASNGYVCVAQAINFFSRVSTKIIDKSFSSKDFEELRKKPVRAIAGVYQKEAALLKKAFGVDTIQELAENRYVRVAQVITTLAYLEELLSKK